MPRFKKIISLITGLFMLILYTTPTNAQTPFFKKFRYPSILNLHPYYYINTNYWYDGVKGPLFREETEDLVGDSPQEE